MNRRRATRAWRALRSRWASCWRSPAAAAAQEVDANGAPIPSIATSLPHNGDPGGIRKWLYERGLTYSFILTSEVLGNVSGGLRQGGVFQGRLEARVNADLEKMIGAKGLSFFVNGFQIHNNGGVRRDLTGSFTTISSIEALPTTRLSELWLEQKLFNDTFSIRAGQLIADSDFFISDVSTFFMNSGWPSIFALNFPAAARAFRSPRPAFASSGNRTSRPCCSPRSTTAIRSAPGRTSRKSRTATA